MKASIVGASGYAGEELIRLLHAHPFVEVAHLTSERHTGERVSKIYPHLKNIYENELVSMEDVRRIAEDSDVLFIALPHGHAMKIVQEVSACSVRIIDLGADYRFADTAIYEQWYHVAHTDPSADRAYGLAELYREHVRTARIIGNAGCYTTASILALAPLVKAHRGAARFHPCRCGVRCIGGGTISEGEHALSGVL